MLKHIVLVKFTDTTSEAHIETFQAKMHALLPILPQIKSLEIGRDILNGDRSWQIAMSMTFATVEDLRAYQDHPEHQKLAEFNKPFLADIATVDYYLAD